MILNASVERESSKSLEGILEIGQTVLSTNHVSPSKKIRKIATTMAKSSTTGIYI